MRSPTETPDAPPNKPTRTLWAWVLRALFGLGIGLFVLNLVGLATPLRSPLLDAKDAPIPAGEAATGTGADVLRTAAADVPRAKLFRSLTQAVNEYVVHAWPEDDADAAAIHCHIPARENYLLWLAGCFFPSYTRYEFTDAGRGLARGIGLCSQQALITVELLTDRGIPARVQRLKGHVVATAAIDDETWWILDPDFGVVIEHDIRSIEEQPSLAKAAYTEAGLSQSQVETLTKIYGPEGNQVRESVFAYAPQEFLLERLAYGLKWLFPLLLCAPFLFSALRRRS